MRKTTILTALTTILAVLLTVPPAMAGTREQPELTDHCLPDSIIVEELATQASPPWADICSGWFETLTGEAGPPAIAVTVQFAEDITTRPTDAQYSLGFDAGDCRWNVEHNDQETVSLFGLDPYVGDRVGVRCNPTTHEVPCPFPYDPVIDCVETTPYTWFELPDGAVVEQGDTYTVTLVLDGALAAWGADFAQGDVLQNIRASAAGLQGYEQGSSVSVNGDTVTVVNDHASGEDYTIEAAEGEGVSGPVIEQGIGSCVAGPVSAGGPASPHFVDAPTDYSPVLRHPDADLSAFDLRSGWFSENPAGGVDLSILPAGPERPGDGRLVYIVEFNDWHASIEENTDGSFKASVVPDREPTEGLPERIDEEGLAMPVTYDPASGLVTVTLPDATLPAAGEAITLDFVFSHYTLGGELSDEQLGSTGVDSTDNGQVCAVTR